MTDLSRPRAEMVRRLRETFPDAHPGVLARLEAVPRHLFVDEPLWHKAYTDASLPIGRGQTLSQPATVLMSMTLLDPSPGETLLEVGSGSGYVAAIASGLCGRVYGMERLMNLVISSRRLIQKLGITNVTLAFGDGSEGWPEHAPYDCMLMSAAAPVVPACLEEQLAPGGRLVIPIGDRSGEQTLQLWLRGHGGMELVSDAGPCRFVPLIGRGGWSG